MQSTAFTLAAELALLSDALDTQGQDIATTVHAFASDAHAAIDSYLGLSVSMKNADAPSFATVLSTLMTPSAARSSLKLPALQQTPTT